MAKTVQYVQRSRKKGARLPPNTMCCTRPGRYGNPFTIRQGYTAWFVLQCNEMFDTKDDAIRQSVEIYRDWFPYRFVRELADADYLACWCKPGAPCHVQDVLLPAVNAWIAESEPK